MIAAWGDWTSDQFRRARALAWWMAASIAAPETVGDMPDSQVPRLCLAHSLATFVVNLGHLLGADLIRMAAPADDPESRADLRCAQVVLELMEADYRQAQLTAGRQRPNSPYESGMCMFSADALSHVSAGLARLAAAVAVGAEYRGPWFGTFLAEQGRRAAVRRRQYPRHPRGPGLQLIPSKAAHEPTAGIRH